VSSLAFVLTSCLAVDNQTVIPPEWQDYFNAKPEARNPNVINQTHQILLAVIDTGVDYNHPFLQSKIHYTLDSSNNSIGAGWDFIGEDAWPLPYLARTRYLYTKDERTQKEEKESLLLGELLLKTDPLLKPYIHPHRLHQYEKQIGMYHGTHVAGLASYDDNRIGIVPYRLLPQSESINGNSKDSNVEFLEYLEKAVEHAAKNNVKVINLSLGMSFKKEKDKDGNLLKLFGRFETLVNDHPEIAFVAASGNESAWHDGEQRFNFPCGINAKNMLCVSALNGQGQLASFTNIPLINSPVVFATGVDIISTMPSAYCNSSAIEDVNSYGSIRALNADEKTTPQKLHDMQVEKAKDLAAKIITECKIDKSGKTKKSNQANLFAGISEKDINDSAANADKGGSSDLEKLSGTSMASPIVARLLAQKILETQTSGAEAIQALLLSAERVQKGPLTLLKLKAPKPAWYKNSNVEGQFNTFSAKSRSDKNFEFIVPQQ
jgi:subtilisin family serine protease